MTVLFEVVDAFAEARFTGNPACVVVLNDKDEDNSPEAVTEEFMQKMARYVRRNWLFELAVRAHRACKHWAKTKTNKTKQDANAPVPPIRRT